MKVEIRDGVTVIRHDDGDPHDSSPTVEETTQMPDDPGVVKPPVTLFGLGIYIVILVFVVFLIRRFIRKH